MPRHTYQSPLHQPSDSSSTKVGEQDDLLMQPQTQQLAFPSHQPFPSVSLDSQADPLTHVLQWMGHHELRDDAHSSSSSTVSNDNAEDDTCNDAPVVDAQLGAGFSRHGEGAVTQVVRPSCHIKRATSTTPSKGECNLVPSTECFTKDKFLEPPVARINHDSYHDLFLDEEAERWDQRQQKTGAIGRLVPYHEGESPNEDIFLRNGGHHHIILAGLRDGGQAAQAGVKVGDRLVSIDGQKDLLGLQAEAIQEGLKAPVVLVFLGFVGKLDVEVRLRLREQVWGISSRQEAVKGRHSAPVHLCEQRVFNVGRAHLFLAVMPNRRSNCHSQHSDDEGEGEKEEADDEDDKPREEVEEEKEKKEQDKAEEAVKRVENNIRLVHSIRSTRQERQQPIPTKQTVTWRRSSGHSTSWTKHVLEVAPCFELQQSDAHRLVKGALQTIDFGSSSNEDSLPSSRSSPSSQYDVVTSLSPRSAFETHRKLVARRRRWNQGA